MLLTLSCTDVPGGKNAMRLVSDDGLVLTDDLDTQPDSNAQEVDLNTNDAWDRSLQLGEAYTPVPDLTSPELDLLDLLLIFPTPPPSLAEGATFRAAAANQSDPIEQTPRDDDDDEPVKVDGQDHEQRGDDARPRVTRTRTRRNVRVKVDVKVSVTTTTVTKQKTSHNGDA